MYQRGPGRFIMDTGILAKIKGIRDIFVNILRDMDTWINFRDMGIQCFLNFGNVCQIYFREMG